MVRIVVRMVSMVHMIILIVMIMIGMGNKLGILQLFDYISDLLTMNQLCEWVVTEAMLKVAVQRLYWMLQKLYWMLQRLCWNVTEAMASSIPFLEMLSHLKKITGKYAERGFHDPEMFRMCHQLHLPFPLKNIMTGHDRDPACWIIDGDWVGAIFS